MNIKGTLLLLLLTTIFAFADTPDDEPCMAHTNAVQTIRIPQDCFIGPESGSLHYIVTNAGAYRFVIETGRVFQVINSFPLGFDVFTMREGESYDFYLPCGWHSNVMTFIDFTSSHIPVARLPVGKFDLYTAGTISTNTQWQKVQTFTNNVANSVFYARMYRHEPQRYYQVRAGE